MGICSDDAFAVKVTAAGFFLLRGKPKLARIIPEDIGFVSENSWKHPAFGVLFIKDWILRSKEKRIFAGGMPMYINIE